MPVSDDPLHTTNNVIESISKTKQSKSRNGMALLFICFGDFLASDDRFQ